jgi:hypothetical protein
MSGMYASFVLCHLILIVQTGMNQRQVYIPESLGLTCTVERVSPFDIWIILTQRMDGDAGSGYINDNNDWDNNNND